MCRPTPARRMRRSMTKSCPLGLRAMAARIASSSSSSLSEWRSGRAEIGGVLLAQAHEERSGAGEPHAVAAFAEIMRERRDQAEPRRSRARRSSAPARRCGNRSRRGSIGVAAGHAPARAADTGRCELSQPMSPIGMTSMSARSKPRSPHQRTRSSNSSSFTPLSATDVELDRGARRASAASMPSSTLSSLPQRVIAANFAGSSVSSETLIRRTPAAFSSPA